MEIEIQLKLNELLNLIENDPRILELKKLKNRLLKDEALLNEISLFQKDPSLEFSDKQGLKQTIYQNNDYHRYQLLEAEIHLLTLEMNKVFNRLTDRKGCVKF